LYFDTLKAKDSNNRTTVKFYGHYFLDITSHPHLYKECIQQLEKLKRFYETHAMKLAQLIKSQPQNVIELEKQKMRYIELTKLYHAMSLWLKATQTENPGELINKITSLQEYYEPIKLVSVINESVINGNV
jgi:hypothetical protein